MVELSEERILQGSELCISCGLCCRGILHFHGVLQPNEVEPISKLGLICVEKEGGMVFQLPCPCYLDARCSVYPNRPAACIGYRCKLLKRFLKNEIDLGASKQLVVDVKALLSVIQQRLQLMDTDQGFWRDLHTSYDLEQALASIARGADADVLVELAALRVKLQRHFQDFTPKADRAD